MDFSIVIPALNEKTRLPPFLLALAKKLQEEPLNAEIIVVDDGGREGDYQAYLKTASSINNLPVKIVRHDKNQGKGAAIQTGFRNASGNWIGFVDADGSTSPQEIVRVIKTALSSPDSDGLFASRILMLGYNVDRRLIRHLSGRIFTTLAWIFLDIPVYDSQCGCKFFKKDKILPFLRLCQEQGYLLDLELIAIGYLSKLNFLEVPINWRHIPGSKVNLLSDSLKMALGILKIRSRLKKLKLL